MKQLIPIDRVQSVMPQEGAVSGWAGANQGGHHTTFRNTWIYDFFNLEIKSGELYQQLLLYSKMIVNIMSFILLFLCCVLVPTKEL